MIPVKKIRDACFLACIESFLRDNGIQIEQECMIKILKQKHLCDARGVVPRGNEKEACLLLNIRFSDVEFHYPIDLTYADGSLLIGTTTGGLHCLRFYKQEEEGKIIVMNPDIGDFEYWDRWRIEQENPNYHRIELIP